ncbi:hypothetical protein HJ051_12765 [Vibrio parahaemolyticus]|nr:hypothetical protein [Vibrio parahaemolyticus]
MKPKKNNRGFELIEENRKAMMFFIDLLLEGYGLTSAIRRLNDAIDKGVFKVELTSRQKKSKWLSNTYVLPSFQR